MSYSTLRLGGDTDQHMHNGRATPVDRKAPRNRVISGQQRFRARQRPATPLGPSDPKALRDTKSNVYDFDDDEEDVDLDAGATLAPTPYSHDNDDACTVEQGVADEMDIDDLFSQLDTVRSLDAVVAQTNALSVDGHDIHFIEGHRDLLVTELTKVKGHFNVADNKAAARERKRKGIKQGQDMPAVSSDGALS